MKRNRKRLMAAFMAVLMVLTLVPTWLLGGVFATTAKADDNVTLGYTFKEADVSKDKKSSSAVIKDGDGTVYEVTAVKGNGAEFSIAGNTLKLKGVSSQANGGVPTEDYGYVKISVKKDCTKISIDYYIESTGNYANCVKVSKDGTATVIASNKAVTNKVLANEEITDVKAGDVIYLYADKAKRLKITGENAIKVTGAFKYIAAPDATKSVVTATQNTEDATKVAVDVKDLAVNEKGPDAYYSLQRAKVAYGSDATPDWAKAEEVGTYTGKETSFKYEDTLSKSGTYYYRVVGKGVAAPDSNGTATTAGISYEADVNVNVTGDVNKLTATWADIGTATSYNVYVYKNTEACPSTPTKTISADEIAAFKKDKKDISYTAEDLTAGIKYNVKVDAVREAGVKSSEVVTVRVLENIDTSKAIEGMKLVDQESSIPLTVIRDKGEITAFQPATTGGVSSKGLTNASYVVLNDQIAADKDFTLTADVTVKSNPASSGSGVYVGAFTDIGKSTAKLYATGFRGANGGAYDIVYYRNKADNSYSGGKYNSVVNTYAIDTTYTVTVKRENGSYTTTVKSADGKLDLTSASEEPAADLKGAVNVGFAVIGTTAVINNLKVVSGDATLMDASKLEGSFSPFSNNWDSYEGTSITETVNDNENGKVKVTVAGEIGTYGAGSIDVNMYNEAGELKDTKTITAWNTTSNTVEFEPDASGTYYLEAVAKRTGVAKTYASEKYKSEGYMLPIEAPVLQLRTAEQSKIEVSWDAVPEATSYKVEYKKEGASEFTFLEETAKLSSKTSSLIVGDVYIFRVTAIRSVDGQSKMSNEAQLKVADHEQFTWKFSAFGQGVSVSNDNLSDKSKSKNGYSGGVNTDEGTVNVWSLDSKGKLVPASTDGVAFYYATIPSDKNFTLTATAKVNTWKYTNGQEGFGLMAADAVGNNGDSSVFWNNSYMASVTKVEYYSGVDEETGEASVSKTSGDKISMKLGIGSQEKIGVNKNNLSKLLDNDSNTVNNEFKTTMSTLETSKLGSAAGTYNLIGNYSNTDATFVGTTVENPITEVKLTIQKNNTGYFVSYTDAEGNTTTKKYYDTAALSQIDSDNVYIGMFASRTCDVTYSDISLTTIDPADDAPAEERPVEYKDIKVNITSASTASSEDYTFKGMSTADGHIVVKKGDDVIGETDVTANESFAIDTKLVAGDNKFVATFTPDENFKFDEYELPTSYDSIEVSKTVTYAYFTGELIYVSADATKAVDEAKADETYSMKAQINEGKGTRENPIDIYNAVAFASAGQKILLMDGDYKVANNLLIPFGINGTSDKPIYLMPESTDSRVVLDFEGTPGEGITLCGNYWYIQNIDVTNSANGKDGIHVCGSYNVLDAVNTYKNGNTGIQISRFSSAQDKTDWPAYNTIKNCTSHNNADAGYEDADGFAAKLTIGKGNAFIGCIAHHNADDGWDFFAKVETGNIPSVVIMNCVAYANGYIEGPDGLIDAGNGNGFKMGGSSLPGSHVIVNSVAFDNKAKGIDSNSCPDNVVVGCTSFNNENSNVALYTNDAKNTNFRTNGVVSFRTANVKVADNLKKKGTQDEVKLFNATDYYWLSATGAANAADKLLKETDFVTLNTSDVKVTRNADGTINMNGLGMLTADARKTLGVGIGADSLDKAPQLTADGYALIAEALGVDEANRILGTTLASIFISRAGTSGALTGDTTNVAIYVILAAISAMALLGVFVYEKKKKGMTK